jgi:lipid-binding SYLF domain-containing protein
MKRIRIAAVLLLVCLAGQAMAIDRDECEQRIHKLMDKFNEMQAKPDKAVPADVLCKAEGIILIDRTRAGFLFSYQGGDGIALVRDARSHRWGPAAFVNGSEASVGLAGGGEQNFFVILLMNRDSIRMVRDSNFEFGGEVTGTAGSTTGGQKGTTSSTDPSVMVYVDSTGFYGGASVKGDSINPDMPANAACYGPRVTMQQILTGGQIKPTDATQELIHQLDLSGNR